MFLHKEGWQGFSSQTQSPPRPSSFHQNDLPFRQDLESNINKSCFMMRTGTRVTENPGLFGQLFCTSHKSPVKLLSDLIGQFSISYLLRFYCATRASHSFSTSCYCSHLSSNFAVLAQPIVLNSTLSTPVAINQSASSTYSARCIAGLQSFTFRRATS